MNEPKKPNPSNEGGKKIVDITERSFPASGIVIPMPDVKPPKGEGDNKKTPPQSKDES